jgi:DNA-binding PadR family transcriptional regulator
MKLPLLALLAARPSHGYELKSAVTTTFGPLLPPLNAGQVYTSLQRLERDGLVTAPAGDDDPRNKRVYEITEAGRRELARWAAEPTRSAHLKDGFGIKLVLAALTGLVDPVELIARQREEYLRALRHLDDVQAQIDGAGRGRLAAELLLEGGALRLQADLRWLDHCERRLAGEHV